MKRLQEPDITIIQVCYIGILANSVRHTSCCAPILVLRCSTEHVFPRFGTPAAVLSFASPPFGIGSVLGAGGQRGVRTYPIFARDRAQPHADFPNCSATLRARTRTAPADAFGVGWGHGPFMPVEDTCPLQAATASPDCAPLVRIGPMSALARPFPWVDRADLPTGSLADRGMGMASGGVANREARRIE
jgi:hypothetical protein